ncbi:uncharacterized protein L199_000648 [Kwoniella botswanensis]|uniref:uncharacterized protein n=1 Tax=Kwoniella botswanensis TaxID=1268659 RepID=UPI00315D56BF
MRTSRLRHANTYIAIRTLGLHKTPKFDSIYNNPSASITLVSSDEVYFRVDPYPLKTGSTVFRNMLSNPNLKPSPISLTSLPMSFEYCLASLTSANPPSQLRSRAGKGSWKWGINSIVKD